MTTEIPSRVSLFLIVAFLMQSHFLGYTAERTRRASIPAEHFWFGVI
jgi:hypothetical protein